MEGVNDIDLLDLVDSAEDTNNLDLYIDRVPPPSIMEFVSDPYFVGGQFHLDPQVAQLIYEIEQPWVREAFVQVGKGSGKSLVATIIPAYETCKMLHMKDPHGYFGLARPTILASINVSVSKVQAQDVIFEQLRDMLATSPYFKSIPSKPKSLSITFSRNKIKLVCGHSNSKAFLGYGTFCATLDEANSLKDTQNRSTAEELYTAVKGSLKTRYPNTYKFVAISSATTPTAWLARQVSSVKHGGEEIPLSPSGLTPSYSTPHSSEPAGEDAEDVFTGIL